MGKTIISSIVINELTSRYSKKPGIGVAYIYCNFRLEDKQKVEDLLLSLLKQLSEGQQSLPAVVKELHNRHQPKKTRPTCDEIFVSLQAVSRLYSRTFFIVDALDECRASDSCRKDFLRRLSDLQANHSIHLFATSRFIPDIEKEFQPDTTLEIRASREDIMSYLINHMQNLSSFNDWNEELQKEIIARIAEAADGMYVTITVREFQSDK